MSRPPNRLRKPMHQGLPLAVAMVFGAGVDAFAQVEEPGFLEAIRIDVTGSRIPRIDGATALPVQIIGRTEILRGNWTTAGEVLAHVAANFNGMNGPLALGEIENPGLASANLRGLGDGNTLVLLNGRRLANYALLSGTVDLNAIPLAAIDRVEILKDGASSIYGTDAIAGVINFITRKDLRGIELTGQAGATQQGGGDHYQATVTAGWGDLGKDRFNAFVTLDWQKDTSIAARERPYASSGYRPDAGIERLGLATFPANIRTPTGSFVNPAYATGCAPPQSLPLRNPVPEGSACGFDSVGAGDLAPSVEWLNAIARATWQFAPGQELFAEYVYARSQLDQRISPTPASRVDTPDQIPIVYPSGGSYYPTEFAGANGLAGPLEVYYRTVALGPRTSEVTTVAQRLVVGAQGSGAGWNYSAAYNHSVNSAEDELASGYVSTSRFVPALASGRINPFGALDSVGADLLASTQIAGPVRDARGTMDQFDLQLSRELTTLPGGPIALAFGGEWRREKLSDQPAPALATGDILGTPLEVGQQQASRSVGAGFVELDIPVTRSLSIGAAARYDHYSDFGGTTNPKFALRWQPIPALLLRASWGTGFRAPSLPDLYTPRFGSTISGFEDPVRCPVTASPADCGFGEYQVQTGGNRDLSPEQSTQATAGVIWEPVAGVSLGLEWWKIHQTNVIGSFDTQQIFDRYDLYGASNVIRGPVDPAYPTLPGPIRTLIEWNQNLGLVDTSGFDVALALRMPATPLGRFEFGLDGTYIQSFTAQLGGQPPIASAGRYGAFDAVPRWRHYAQLNWQSGPWGATLGQLFQSGYVDQNPDAQGNARRVGTYSLWDLQATYSGFPNTSIALGIRNLFDTDPPFSNQTDTVQTGFDPVYADPRGRSLYLRFTYTFH